MIPASAVEIALLLKKISKIERDGENYYGYVDSDFDIPPSMAELMEFTGDQKVTIFTDAVRDSGLKLYFKKSGYSRFTPGDQVYIIEGSLCSVTDDDRGYFDGLNAYLDCVDMIRRVADFANSEMLFLHEEKSLRLPIRVVPYSKIYGLVFPTELRDSVFVDDGTQLSRFSIFKRVLIDLLENVQEDERPAVLAGSWQRVGHIFKERYRQFILSAGIHRVRDDIRREHTDFLKRYQALVADSGAKMIAIPAGYLFLGLQTGGTPTFPGRNLVVVIGAGLFALVLLVTLSLQVLDLLSLRSGILAYCKEKRAEASDEVEYLTSIFQPLHIRIWILVALCSLFALSVLGLLLIAFSAFPISAPATPSSSEGRNLNMFSNRV